MAQIDDFGQKIGGARKDMWKLTGITHDDFADMNDLERNTYVKKDNIWIKPDWEKLIAEGTPQAVAYWQNKMRQSLPPKPPGTSEEEQQNYIAVVTQIRDAVMAVQDQFDIKDFYHDFLRPNYVNSNSGSYYVTIVPMASEIVTNKVLKAAQARYSTLEREAKEKLFGVSKDDKVYVAAKQDLEIYCYDGKSITLTEEPGDSSTCMTVNHGYGRSFYYFREGSEFHDIDKWKENTYFVMGKNRKPLRINIPTREEAEKFVEDFARASQIAAGIESHSKDNANNSNRKKNFVPPQLAHIRYSGPDYRGGKSADSQMFLDDLKFRGGEFGNWLNTADRQTSLDMAYDALQNLATILKVRPEDISLNGNLAIAFGARGKGGANAGAAHYEPLRQVINLTKMSGAGCLAHEWAHALDHAIGMKAGAPDFASEVKRPRSGMEIPESFLDLMHKLRYKEAVLPAEDIKKELEPDIKKAQKNLHNWIESVRPMRLPEDLSKAWNDAEKRIMDNPSSFTGGEYWSVSRRDNITTHPDVEQLSQICKYATNHVIPRSSKQQIALWAKELNRLSEREKAVAATKTTVKTEFYNNSIEFDKTYSKYGHGYWQSSCEMFARAFDCYIADKVKEQGYRSDYLSANSDSFSFKDGNRIVAAFPQGEERAVINQAFDNLFQELKELQFLHDAPVLGSVIAPKTQDQQPAHSRRSMPFNQSDKPVHYEQLSLDEILFSASERASQGSSGDKGTRTGHTR